MILVVISKQNITTDTLLVESIRRYGQINNFRIDEEPIIVRIDGAPLVKNYPLFVSASHSGDYVVCAVSLDMVGVDIEKMTERDYLTISKRVFNKEIGDKKEFYARWTSGEAYKKASGESLLTSLASNKKAHVVDFLDGYSLAVYGEGNIFYCFY